MSYLYYVRILFANYELKNPVKIMSESQPFQLGKKIRNRTENLLTDNKNKKM